MEGSRASCVITVPARGCSQGAEAQLLQHFADCPRPGGNAAAPPITDVRELSRLNHSVHLMPVAQVKSDVKRGKTDSN